MSQVQEDRKNWTAGIKKTVSFASLEAVKKYEPNTCLLFKEPLEDGDKASDDKYEYRLKHSSRFGVGGVLQGSRRGRVSYGSVTVVQQQPQQTQRQQSRLITSEVANA